MDFRLIVGVLLTVLMRIDSSCINSRASTASYICTGEVQNPGSTISNTIEHLSIVNATIPSLGFIQRLANLKSLELNLVKFTNDPQWTAVQALNRELEILQVVHTKLTSLELLQLEEQRHWVKLMKLTIQNTDISSITASQISQASLPELEFLNLDNNRITALDFTLRTGDRKLRSVSAVNNSIQHATALEYKYLFALQHLNLSNNILSNGSMLVGAANTLETVDLSDNLLLNFSMAQSPAMKLTRINLANNQLSSVHIPNGQNLTELNLAGNRRLNWTNIKGVLDLTNNLKSLNLSGTGINQVDLYNFHQLSTLDLSQNPKLFDSNNTNMYRLYLPALHTLNLQNTGIQGDDFGCNIHLGELRHLTISSNPIQSLQLLEKLSNLQTLDLSNTLNSDDDQLDVCRETDLSANTNLEISISKSDLQLVNEEECLCEDKCGQWRALFQRLQPKKICAAVTDDSTSCIGLSEINSWKCNIQTLCSPAVGLPTEVAPRKAFHSLYPLEIVSLFIGYGLAVVALLAVAYKHVEYRRLMKGVFNNRSIFADSDGSSISDLESNDTKRRSRCPTPTPLESQSAASTLKGKNVDEAVKDAKKGRSTTMKQTKNKSPSFKKALTNTYQGTPVFCFDQQGLARSRSHSMSPCYIPSYGGEDHCYATTSPLARRADLFSSRPALQRSRSLTELNGPAINDSSKRAPSSEECWIEAIPPVGLYDYADRPMPMLQIGPQRARSQGFLTLGYPTSQATLRAGITKNPGHPSPFASRRKFYHSPSPQPRRF